MNHLRELVKGNIGIKCADFYSFYEAVRLSDTKTCIGKEIENLKELEEQGNAEAQFLLALMYINGEGIDQDFEKVLYWYERSAE